MKEIERNHTKLDDATFNSMFAVLQSGMWLLNDLEDYLRPFDMSQGRLSVLLSILESSSGEIHPADIALMTGKSRPTVSKMISRLDAEGYARQHPHEHDARSKKLEITEKGFKLLESVVPGYNDRIRRMSKGLSKQEKVLLLRLLSKIDFLDSEKKLRTV